MLRTVISTSYTSRLASPVLLHRVARQSYGSAAATSAHHHDDHHHDDHHHDDHHHDDHHHGHHHEEGPAPGYMFARKVRYYSHCLSLSLLYQTA
jgi:Ni/Co efflux regulator RcnB